jgi:hypothetical protein
MKKRYFFCLAAFLIVALSSGENCSGQTYTIRGRIIDETTKMGIADAHISSAASYTITDSAGYFRLSVKTLPVTLKISHISYGTFEQVVTGITKEVLVISIRQEVTNLDEVQVSGKRLMILTRSEPYSVQEFEIGQKMIWFIGMINNRPDQKRLFLANLFADTLCSIPVSGQVSLYRDVFNNVHLVEKDTVYQLYTSGKDGIGLLYPYETGSFFKMMDGCELALDQKLVYVRRSPDLSGTQVFYIRENDPVKHVLASMVNSTLNMQRRTAAKIDSYVIRWGRPELIDIWSTIYRYNKRGTRFDRVVNPPVPASVFRNDRNLFIINYLKDSLLKYSLEGEFLGAMTIGFHKEEFYTDERFRKLKFFTDPYSHRVYMLENLTGRWILEQLDPDRGVVIRTIPLPDYPGMERIQIYDNAVYFLYQEKTFPYYSRIFRLVI